MSLAFYEENEEISFTPITTDLSKILHFITMIKKYNGKKRGSGKRGGGLLQ